LAIGDWLKEERGVGEKQRNWYLTVKMSSKSEKKRLSDVTNAAAEAAETKPEKKAKCNQTKEEHWKALLPYLKTTNKTNVENLAKNLFEELWNTDGEETAAAITAPFVKQVATEQAKTNGLAGKWVTDGGGTLTIGPGRKTAKLNCNEDGVVVWDLELQSSESASEWIYTASGTYQWDEVPSFYSHLNVTMKLWYDSDSDTIEGEIEIGPIPPHTMCDSSLDFTAKRKRA